MLLQRLLFYCRSSENERCFRKQLKDLLCPTCHIRYTEESAGTSAISDLLLSTKDTTQSYTVFTQQLLSLQEQLKLNTPITDASFINELHKLLPVKIMFKPQANKINSIRCI